MGIAHLLRNHAIVAAALCLGLAQACVPGSQTREGGEELACDMGGTCPSGHTCLLGLCLETCEVEGTCADAGATPDASCVAQGSCEDDAGLEPDAGPEPDASCATPGTCVDASVDEGPSCADAPCFPGVTCTDLAANQGGGYSCGACPAGYHGDGVTCSNIDGCAGSPCYPGVSCSDVPAAEVATLGVEFVCGACPGGYQGDGQTCSDINECASDPCASDQTCNNTVGSYECVDNQPADCTLWDYTANAPCLSGIYNCDCSGHCGATSPCGTTDPPDTNWPPSDADEIASYHGRYNGDRPTWYFSQVMSAYPATFTVIVVGCGTVNVVNNGVRYESNGYIVKQSDVAGRGMAVVAPASCQSERCYLRY